MSSVWSRPLLSLTPVRGRPSRTGFDESRSAKRRTLASTLGECTIGGVPPGKRQNEQKMLGASAEQDNEKHIQLLLSSPSQRRSYRRPSSLTPVPATWGQAESRDRDAGIFTRPAPRLVWSGAASVGSAPFFCRKKSTKNHWIAWQSTFKALDLKSNGVSPRRFEPCSQRMTFFFAHTSNVRTVGPPWVVWFFSVFFFPKPRALWSFLPIVLALLHYFYRWPQIRKAAGSNCEVNRCRFDVWKPKEISQLKLVFPFHLVIDYVRW